MTVYDPIEFPVGDARGGYGYHSNNVATPGYETRRGYEFTAVEVYGANPPNVGYLNARISWNAAAMTEDPNLPLPGVLGGDENIVYKITIQAIDLTEEE